MWSKRAAAIGLAVALAAACRPAPERLALDGRTLTVLNDSNREWRGVEVWINDHYRVTKPAMAAGERFVVPLDTFVAGMGQRFPAVQQVSGIELTATDESGAPVRVVWGSGRRR